jgi:ketosteroid isomerase-like protein
MSDRSEENKRIARGYLDEVWNRGQLDRLEHWVVPDYRGMTRAAGQTAAEGPEGLKRWVAGVFATFSHVHKEVKALVAEGDDVVAEVLFTATHPATGRTIRADQLYLLRLRDGKVASESIFFDTGGVLKELSAPPACAVR